MKETNRIFEITVLNSAYEFEFKYGFEFLGESHDFWEAFCVTSGSIEVTCDDSVYSMGAGDMIFYPPLSFHKINRVGKNGVHILNISFKVSGDIPDKLPCSVFSLTAEEVAVFESTFALIGRAVKNTLQHPYESQLACDRLSALMIELSYSHSAEERFLHSASANEYRQLVSYMKEHIFDNFSLSELASENHISVSYVKLLFNRYAGISPKTYYSQLRLNTAKALLKSRASVAEISANMNFSSPNYFTRWFKKGTGISPSEYRQ